MSIFCHSFKIKVQLFHLIILLLLICANHILYFWLFGKIYFLFIFNTVMLSISLIKMKNKIVIILVYSNWMYKLWFKNWYCSLYAMAMFIWFILTGFWYALFSLKNSQLTLGFEPRNPYIWGRDASHCSLKEPEFESYFGYHLWHFFNKH